MCRKLIASSLILTWFICGIGFHGQMVPSASASANPQDDFRLVSFPLGFTPAAYNNVVFSGDGKVGFVGSEYKVGFVGSEYNGRLFSFDTTTGEMIGSIVTSVDFRAVYVYEEPGRRIVLVPGPNAVKTIDATDPANMRVQASFYPPAGRGFVGGQDNLAMSSDGKVGFVASYYDATHLYAFDCNTGALLGEIVIPVIFISVSAVQSSGRQLIGVNGLDAPGPEVTTMVDATTPATPKIVWSKRLANVAFDRIVFNSAGTIGYVVGHLAQGYGALSFRVDNGNIINSLLIPRLQTSSGYPTLNDLTGTLALMGNSSEVLVLHTTQDGTLSLQATFMLPDKASLAANNPALSLDGSLGFVASYSTAKLYVFRTSDGTLVKSVQMQGGSYNVASFRRAGKRLVSVINVDFSPSVTLVDYTDPSNIAIASQFRPNGAFFSETNNIPCSRDSRVCFIASTSTDLAYSVDTSTGEILDSVVPGDNPGNVSVVEDGSTRLLLVVNGGSISVIDASDPRDMKILKSILPPSGAYFGGNNAVISPDGQFFFIADTSGRIFNFEISSGTLVSGALVGGGPGKIAYSPASGTIAVVNPTSDTVSLVKVGAFGNLSLAATFTPPGGSDFSSITNVAFSPKGDVCYIASVSNRVVHSFDINGNLLSSKKLADEPTTLFLSGDGKLLAVSLKTSVTLLNTNESGDLFAGIALAGSTSSGDNVVFSSSNDKLYVASQTEGMLLTYSSGGSLLDTISIGERPASITRLADGQLAVNRSSNTVALIDPKFK